MASSAPQSPARRDGGSYFDTSPERPSPSKLLRLHHLFVDRAASLPPRRLSSPAKKTPQIRPRLNQYYTLDHAVSLFKSSRNIIVLTGAGISTSLGVPDFRSANGVYNLLVDSVYDDPQELFHIENFKADPEEFFKQAAKVFPKMQGLVPSNGTAAPPLVPKFSRTHAFIAMLQAKGKLLTNYTQNIDGLEVAAGVSQSKLIQCHGTLGTATCMSCGKRVTARKYMPVVQAGGVPYCKCSLEDGGPRPSTKTKHRGRTGRKKRKRDEYEDSDSEESNGRAGFPKGLLKPDMTFFGEEIADSYAPRLKLDKSKVDLLVIIGTSLKVEPVNEMLLNIPPTVPQIWISKDRCQREGVKVDIELLGECDLILEEIARRAGWEDALRERLWTGGKASEPKRSQPKPHSDRSHEINRPKRQEDGTSPVKPERPLQIRQKSTESPSLAMNPAPEVVVIKVNGEEIPPIAGAETAPNSTGQVIEVPLENPVEMKVENGYMSVKNDPSRENPVRHEKREDERPSLKQQTKSCPAPRVVVELEEGTRNRWYVRRAK
ncbi:NAD-dependent histone deacetylase SIR2 [Cladophialophora carrionii]|uniref:NAD-dependent histone deacetylase SIR2 n=1 Tax=Cladophialophora carrionii TaxID=86049 RepID=A0A1C1CTM1_9EURO|nr:NAD-dependent histone deacetylase SIR2 [Cladophialophora carrionii]